MSFWEPCWACCLMRGETTGGIVAATDAVVAAINPFPLADGHVLVLPRRHIIDVFDLPDALAGPVLRMASRVARAQKLAFGADGVTLRQNNGAASDQHLFHFHLHVVPRFEGDAETFNREPERVATSIQQAMARKISQALSLSVP